ncbi:Kinesin motor domain containing protein [Tritrichomonas foetus]|uniref:Kinesin-like protein n=1 Tax=Tritrichomonas foetus TaxID=1144522 RepID=A0A1J4KDU3_9EUKA|nr:Kinesin motor domain containing protein [Tritrichomonas foetus]|eukprot:OHT07629.1 Kinesin motor domain containing protein [Tritrichomonas foetus]
MTEESIKVYARVRPCMDPNNDFPGVAIDELDPCKLRIDYDSITSTNGAQNQHLFKFDNIFWKDSLQEDVFSIIALPLIDHTMEGFNSTLFAYGQTGSGKTFTITGDGTPNCMGIVPRALKYVYDKISNDQSRTFKVSISYLEIYNNVAYDLLTQISSNQVMKLDDLTKVTIADTGTETVFKDLSVEPAPTIDEAHRLFWAGECVREKAATVNNKYSSRSHTIFTMYFKTSDETSVTNSRINFVDLAGSEKYESLSNDINKRKLEARHINKSLHTLQNVIIGLNNKQKHIPFRDSALTRFLKDSLVGNVKTAMIATISTNKSHMPESISTCRFSESVAAVTTVTRVNQTEMTPQEIIQKLREEVTRLRSDLSRIAYTNSVPGASGFISPAEGNELQQQVTEFVEDRSDELNVFAPPQVQYCFQQMKELIRKGNSSALKVSQLQQTLVENQRNVQNLVFWIKTPQQQQQKSRTGDDAISKEEAYVEFCNSHEKWVTQVRMKDLISERCNHGKKLNKKAKHIAVTKLKREDKLNIIRETIKTLEADQSLEKDEATMKAIEEAKKAEAAMIERIKGTTEDLQAAQDELKSCKEDIVALSNEFKKTSGIIQRDFEKFWMSTILRHGKAPIQPMTPIPTQKKGKKKGHPVYSTLRPVSPRKPL